MSTGGGVSEEVQALQRAREARERGDVWTAMEQCRDLLAADQRSPEAWYLMGNCLAEVGDLPGAMTCLSRAIERASGKAAYHARLGEVYTRLGRLKEALDCYQRAVELDGQDVDVLHGRAVALWGAGRWKEAEEGLEGVVERHPDHAFARRNLSLLRGRMVDRWHFSMINDEVRNRVFEQALVKAIGEDTVVLDLGAGTGLLSLMAARAGARRVIACEANPRLAELATEIVAANGYADRIHVLAKPSQQIDPKTDFPEGRKPDVLVAEVFDTMVIGEGALNALDHARHFLLAPEGKIIPRRAELWGGLIQSERAWREGGADRAAGFDLTALNRFGPATVGLEAASFRGELLSDDFLIFPFDFAVGEAPTPTSRSLEVPVLRSGTCHGVVFWIRLSLAEGLTLDSRPDFGGSGSTTYCDHWYQLVKILAPPPRVEAGMTVRIEARHNRENVALVVYDPVSGEPLG